VFDSNKHFNGIEELLSKLGLKPGSLYKVRFGGVVGKIAFVSIALVAPAVVVAYRTADNTVQLCCLGYGALVGILSIGAMLFYGHKHPLEATLEGSQIVALKELQNQYAAKGVLEIPYQQPVTKTIDVKALEDRGREGPR
jgi:hypothetical protein